MGDLYQFRHYEKVYMHSGYFLKQIQRSYIPWRSKLEVFIVIRNFQNEIILKSI